MNIIYILTIVLMITLHILLHKKQEKQSLLKWTIISIIMFLCYNIFICVVLSYLKIPSTLTNLSVINIVVDIIFATKIYKDKKIQKYEISKIDILAVLIMTIMLIVFMVIQYGIPLNIKNGITDASVHFYAADNFYNYSFLLSEKNSDELNLWSFQFMMPGAYINTGILFKLFSGIMSETYFYKLYFIFDAFIWLLSGILMYILLSKNKEGKQKILPLIFSLVYMLGYPLNSLISGFSYLSVGLNIIIAILIVMQEQINKYYKYILIFLLNIGIFFSYYFFAPVVYLAMFLQIIADIKIKNEKLFKLENILNILFTLIIPGFFGILYFIVFQKIKFGGTPNYSNIINIDGSIYSNLITNILIFLLLSIFYIIYCIKNKKQEMSNKMFILNIIFVITLFIGMKLNKVSEYYYYKTYYLTWILVIYTGYKGLEQIILKGKKSKIISYIAIIIYIIGLISALILKQKLGIFDIYKDNSNEIHSNKTKLVTTDEIEILEYYNSNINTSKDNLDTQTYMGITLRDARAFWIYAITRNPYTYIDLLYGNPTKDLNQFINIDRKYYVLFKEDYFGDYNQIYMDIEKCNLKILYKNEAGIILEKN